MANFEHLVTVPEMSYLSIKSTNEQLIRWCRSFAMFQRFITNVIDATVQNKKKRTKANLESLILKLYLSYIKKKRCISLEIKNINLEIIKKLENDEHFLIFSLAFIS
ncbi:hypothetical protein BpHYR1_027227 [Brachionus plicatilis]|uniref:Uncharacterized protein n=1 Tax=Brachionus plicatilis TaxID=10195 RepID=A0A3M7T8A1_BRAPC|nr:hypothetical protein BpHYR1_027227 [Brachionus plicatilis]